VPRSDPLTPKELEGLWTGLRDADAEKAHRDLCKLAAAPEQAVVFLSKHLQPVPTVSPARLARLLADLDSDEFLVRERATQELRDLAELAENEVRTALEGRPSPEARRRLKAVLGYLESLPSPPQRLQALRAVEVLEQIGTSASRQLLERLSRGAAGAWLTQEAEASRERLQRRTAAPSRSP
jgi:hypothetical protein